MLNHIGIAINNVSEIKNFYQNVLGMKIVKHFTINKDLSNQVFQINKETEIYIMKKDDLILELFINKNSVPNRYDHICISVSSRSDFIQQTKNNNYTCKIIPRENFDFVFIKDRLGNKFEIKEK